MDVGTAASELLAKAGRLIDGLRGEDALEAVRRHLDGLAGWAAGAASGGWWHFAMGFACALLLLTLLERLRRRAARPRSRSHAGAGDGQGAQELAHVLRASRGAFLTVGLFSGVVNLLMLTSSVFMLEVYDRVLPSRSLPTLVVLAAAVAFLLAALGVVDLIRQRMLVRIGETLHEGLGRRVFGAAMQLPLMARSRASGEQPLRDLDTARQFLSGLGPTALFDLPWIPLYLGLIYSFHPLLGHTALIGAVVLVALTLLTEALTRAPMREAGAAGALRAQVTEAGLRNAEVLNAMGLASRMAERWQQAGRRLVGRQRRAADVAAALGSLSKVLRMVLQSGMLAVGAYLVIRGEATGGVIIASSILTSRALAPVELAIGQWKGFLAARQSWMRLKKLLQAVPAAASPLPLPVPVLSLAAEGLAVAPPGEQRLAVSEASFTLRSGQGLGIIGPSASGKSSLVRALVGVWRPARGRVRLDGAALDQWSSEDLGRHIGYLPQDVELFAGTVAENIARFDPDASPEQVIEAAQAAGVHDLVVALPNGYETEIGDGGAVLSAGQRQRIALARALYGEPFLVVLDEPNSNLDNEGEAALTRAIHAVRQRGGIVVVVAHRPSAIAALDMVLAMSGGRQAAFGPKEQVLGKVLGTSAPGAVPLKVVPSSVGMQA
jgi:ATP-binding cassette subfamily C protein